MSRLLIEMITEGDYNHLSKLLLIATCNVRLFFCLMNASIRSCFADQLLLSTLYTCNLESRHARGEGLTFANGTSQANRTRVTSKIR